MMSATFAFARSQSSESVKLWDGVSRELQWVQSALPLWATSRRFPCAPDVAASESSGYGIGVCRRQLPVDVAAEFGAFRRR